MSSRAKGPKGPVGKPEPGAKRAPAALSDASPLTKVLALHRDAGNSAIALAMRGGSMSYPGALDQAIMQRQVSGTVAPPFNPVVAGPGGAAPQTVPAVPGTTGDAAQDLAAADAFHASGIRGPQAIQSSSGIGGFSATYNPSADTLTISIKGSVVFTDGIQVDGSGALVPGDPGLAGVIGRVPPPGPRRDAFLTAFQWTSAEETPFLTGLESAVEGAWGGRHEFHVNRSQWDWIGARVAVDIQVRKQEGSGRAADDHFSIKVVKTPPEGTGALNLQGSEQVNSQVAGDTNRTNAFDQEMTLGSQDILPSRNPLLATVPVFFQHDRDNVQATERQKIRDFGSQWQGAAPGTAGSRPASVELRATTTASGSDEYNLGLAQRRADAVKAELSADGFNNINTRVASTPLGEGPAAGSEDPTFRRVDMIPDGGESQTVAVHEFGHAFGLDDEYGAEFGAGRPAPGTPVGHDPATRAMTDATGGNLPGAVVENNNNIMSVGNVVRPQHYSTFHEALRAITGIEEWALGPKQARPGPTGGTPAPGGSPGPGGP